MSGPWLLCDYGEVLCQGPPPAQVDLLAALAGLGRPGFDHRYWEHRADYDRGDLTAAAYWTAVTGDGDRTREHLAELVGVDVDGWLHPARATLAATTRAAGRGLRLALLSNAPHEVADAIDALDWLAGFAPRLFSARLGVIKPDHQVYARALDALGAEPGQVWFVDDRPANVAAATEMGIRAVHYTGDPAAIDGIPGP